MPAKKPAAETETVPVLQNLSEARPGEPKEPSVITYPDGTVRRDN